MKKIKIKTLCLSVISILALHSNAVFAGSIDEQPVIVSPDNSISNVTVKNQNSTQETNDAKLSNNDVTKDKISDDAVTKAINEEINTNPYAGTPLEAEDYTQKSKILDSEISFYSKKIELQKKRDDLDLSPLKRKLAESNLNSQLLESEGYSPTQGKNNKEPQISEEEINRRIKAGIDRVVQEENQLKERKQIDIKQQTIRKESQFSLKMISNQKDKTSAIVENGDKTYNVKVGDKIGKWSVIEISNEGEYVTIKNGKVFKKVTYFERNPVINITKPASKTNDQQPGQENTIDQTLPVPPNFNN